MLLSCYSTRTVLKQVKKLSVCTIARLWCGCVLISAPHGDPVFLLLIHFWYLFW